MNVFTYGSLMFPEVWSRVVRGSYRQSAASAVGYRRFAIKDETHPGMVAAVAAEGNAVFLVEGIVYFDIDSADVAALDEFEGPEYRRVEIEVTLPDSKAASASTYLYLTNEKLADELWLPATFELQRFLARYCAMNDERRDGSVPRDDRR